MRIKADIPVAQIVYDRLPIGTRTLALIKHLEAGGKVPSIHVTPIANGRYRILDGRHRLLAHMMLGRSHIYARWGEQT